MFLQSNINISNRKINRIGIHTHFFHNYDIRFPSRPVPRPASRPAMRPAIQFELTRTAHTISLGHILPDHTLASSYRPAHCRYGGIFFPISPDPLLPTLSCLRALNVPPPPGRGTSRLASVRTVRASIQSACFQSSCPLTHSVRSLLTRCLLTNETGDGTTDGTRSSDERRVERRDERRDERMERQQIQEKRAGRRHPVSPPACSVSCL